MISSHLSDSEQLDRLLDRCTTRGICSLTPGRGSAAQATSGLGGLGKQAGAIAGQDQQIQGAARGQGQNIVNSEVNTSGGLSPLVSKQLANQEGQIGKTYGSLNQAAQRGLAARGMGGAPTGASASLANTAANNTAQTQTGAIGNAFGTQNQLNQSALGYDQGQQQIYNPLNAINAGTNAYGAESNAAVNQGKLGSTLGDITGIVGGVAGGLAPGLNGITKQIASGVAGGLG
jgi:hypothetical protein